jgi:uncharacterized membrane protein
VLQYLHEFNVDLASAVASAALLLGYESYLRLRLRKDPDYTIQNVNRRVRAAWVESIMHDPGLAVLAVQTLRNSTMAATFLASTAVLLIMGVLTLSASAGKLADSWHALNLLGSIHTGLLMTKLLTLVVDFVVAFFAFAMALRLYNHVGYQVNIPPGLDSPPVTPHQVAVHLNRAGAFYSIGMRAYFYAVPLLFWPFGPFMMIIASVALVAVLFHLDRSPAAERATEADA